MLFAVGAFALAGGCVAGMIGETDSPEGMAWMAFAVMGVTFVLGGCCFLLIGLLLLARRAPVGPAWLVDPVDPAFARWWDGQAWTDHTSPRSPGTVALAPLTSSSARRRLVGSVLLVGGILVAVGSEWFTSATVVPATSPDQPMDQTWVLVSQLVTPALGAGVLGLYLLLTLTDDVRPGWQRDPLDPEQVRWWDGRAWSDSTTHA